ncbi:unnamed protein product [Medioppia subpectinata]|uniref:F-box domain-containing protein n=1 Tax=Medioppia subpectinata TaxID=1979941 RepID=A0A7R9KTY7_9ACAR|nr:unnamed protein product [Medioppia subpectinata]CAG2109775.1 unnamed protein product [Medioppia subpectinata]
MAQEVKHLKTSLETTDDCEDEDNKQIYAKNSLDRFGDDLYEVLLTYLSLEDRFRCECVSKQFQRTVFVSVVDITLSDEFIQRLMNAKRSYVQMLATIAINVHSFHNITDFTNDTLFGNNLHKLVLNFHSDPFNHFWSAFVAHNQSLQCLVLKSCYFENTIFMTEMCGQLSRLTQLRELSLGLVFGELDDQKSAVVNQSLRTIGVNCKQLQRLSLRLQSSTNISLNSLRVYRRLKRLHLSAFAAIDDQLLDPLSDCKRLTHLGLDLPRMTANVLKDLHIKCPRLQYLLISNFHNNTECLSHISRLPALQMLVIDFEEWESYDFSDNDFWDLLSKNMAQQMKRNKTSLETTDDGNEDYIQHPMIYAKNSMDRFGDDLCALIVSYLSLEDRFRYECVSKQFQRTVFGSVVDITLNVRFIWRLLNAKRSDVQMLATIAIKCPKIETIDCRRIDTEYESRIPEMLYLFRDYCRHLGEIYCDLWENNDQSMRSLAPLITRIGGNVRALPDRQWLTLFYRLSHLRVDSIDKVFDKSNGKLLAKNLRNFVLLSHSQHYNHRWPAFVAANQSLQSLAVKSCHFVSKQSVREMCGQLSRLTQLRELTLGLTLRLTDGNNISVLNVFLRKIAANCKQLQRLSLEWSSMPNEPLFTLDSLRVFRQMKRFRLQTDADIDDHLLEPLTHCKTLTHLELHLKRMTPNVLTDLHQYCSQLQYLYIDDMNSIIDTECLDHISRLPALQKFVIKRRRKTTFSDNTVQKFLAKSPKLVSIKIV